MIIFGRERRQHALGTRWTVPQKSRRLPPGPWNPPPQSGSPAGSSPHPDKRPVIEEMLALGNATSLVWNFGGNYVLECAFDWMRRAELAA